MALVVRMEHFDRYTRDDIEYAIYETPKEITLRRAAATIIRAIHALPEAMGCELRQLEVYLGRAGAEYERIKDRWSTRYRNFDYAPSTHAMIVARASTNKLREQQWERAGHLIINSLTSNNALCCANALTGDSGRWPDTDECLLYVVAKTRKGPAGYGIDDHSLHCALGELLLNDSLEDGVVRDVGKAILNQDDYDPHELFQPEDEGEDEDEDEGPRSCRRESCSYPALGGNYGFCGKHRSYIPDGRQQCRVCDRVARRGNYGFCGFHRR